MRITFAASECVPYSKTGGLADVVGALPQALAALGHDVNVFLPRYKQTKLPQARMALASVTVPFDDHYRFCTVLEGPANNGVKFYFIDYPQFFDRDALYGTPSGDYPDNAERFSLYSRAVIEASKVLGPPDVFHCHDWQSALVPILLRSLYSGDPALRHASTLFTIHNMGYQGLFSPEVIPLLNLPWDLFTIGKLACKKDLLAQFGLPEADLKLPVLGIVSRFAAQKGFDLIAQAADRLAREKMIVVALGAGDKEYEELFRRLNQQFPQKFAVKVSYDNAIDHKIEAGADMLLMPSRCEPCGLHQIYSLKYGTVPIVGATGVLCYAIP